MITMRFANGAGWTIDIRVQPNTGGYQVVRTLDGEQKVIGFRPGYLLRSDANRVALTEALRLDDLEQRGRLL